MWYETTIRYLEPDPLLLVTRQQDEEGEGRVGNPRFDALNQAIVQLVSAFPYTHYFPLSSDRPNRPMQYNSDTQPLLLLSLSFPCLDMNFTSWADRGPPACIILASRSHRSRVYRDRDQPHRLYDAIWRRRGTKRGGVFQIHKQ